MTDERFTQTAALFHQAGRLLSDLTAVGQSLPKPEMSARWSADWSEAHSYAICVERLRSNLAATLRLVMTDLQVRNDRQILEALIPPERRR